MAKLVIHTKAAPAHPADHAINAGQFQPGDVVTVLDDAVEFGTHDLGDWNTPIYCPGVPVADLEHLMSAQSPLGQAIGDDQPNNEVMRIRMWNCPPDKLADLQVAHGGAPAIPSKVLAQKGGFTFENLTATIDPMEFTEAFFVRTDRAPDPKVIG